MVKSLCLLSAFVLVSCGMASVHSGEGAQLNVSSGTGCTTAEAFLRFDYLVNTTHDIEAVNRELMYTGLCTRFQSHENVRVVGEQDELRKVRRPDGTELWTSWVWLHHRLGAVTTSTSAIWVRQQRVVIRLGTSGQQTETFIAGVVNSSSVSGPYVVIDSTTGQLGVSSTPPATGVKTAYVPKLQKEVQRQPEEFRDLKSQQGRQIAIQDEHSAAQDVKINQLTGQLAEMHAALDKLQSEGELVAKR